MLYQTKNPHGGDIYAQKILLDYSANTNPYGTPQAVKDAVSGALDELNNYPDPYCRELVRAISEFEGVPQEYIFCGNGAADVIYSYCQALHPKSAVELAPTFSEYSLGLERTNCRVSRYNLRRENDFDLDEGFFGFLEREKPEAVFLCNPNNPTGRLIAPEMLEKTLSFCKSHGASLFIDECFLDLADGGTSMKKHLAAHPELFILKAFTKSYGMAGVRLGYCMTADTALLTEMSKMSQPWNVSVLAQAAGRAALGETEFLAKTRALIPPEREWLKQRLEELGFWVCPSSANYLLFYCGMELHTKLRERGIAIRNCDNYHGLAAGWYRIAVRLHEQNERLIAAIGQLCGKD